MGAMSYPRQGMCQQKQGPGRSSDFEVGSSLMVEKIAAGPVLVTLGIVTKVMDPA